MAAAPSLVLAAALLGQHGGALASSTAVHVYVDPAAGSDAGNGSPSRPVASLLKAKALVRAAVGAGDAVTVHLAAGSHFDLAKPGQGGDGFTLSAADTGLVHWLGEGAAGATISGAITMPAWVRVKAKGSVGGDDGLEVVATACNASDPTQQGWGYDSATGHITHGGRCLSADFWGPPVNLYACGNASTHQNWTYGSSSAGAAASSSSPPPPPPPPPPPSRHYSTVARANTAKLYPAALEAGSTDIHPGIQKAYVYRPEAEQPSMNWDKIGGGGVLRNPDTDQCLAVRPPWQPPPTAVWTAPLPSGGQSRHLYVDGMRANRTRIPAWSVPSTTTDAGYVLTDAAWCKTVLAWPNPSTVELIFHAAPWTESRITVANVTAAAPGKGCEIHMAQPAWYNIRHKPAQALGGGRPIAIENDGVTALEIGQFYVDVKRGSIRLATGLAADLSRSADVAMPVLEVLLRADGLSGHTFSNIHFTHATWRLPSGPAGYVEQQSGCIHASNGSAIATPANIQLERVSSFTFDGCSFTRLGAIALDISGGSHGNAVDGCLFEDVSAAAVQIGGYSTWLAQNSTAIDQDNGNRVTNCVIQRVAVEYIGHVGVIVGFAADTVISHNYVANLTYGGLSVGWGWTLAPTFCRNNTISFNDIGYYKRPSTGFESTTPGLQDGGGIYMLGPQNGSRIFSNYVHDQLDGGVTGALYPDQGSAYSHWYSNVVERTHGAAWLHIWTRNIHDVNVSGNFADTPALHDAGTRCPVTGTTVYAPGNRTAAAQRIVDAAGPIRSRWLDGGKVGPLR